MRTAPGAGAAGAAVAAHVHTWGQLLYVVAGAVSLVAEDGAWTAPAGASVWAAAGKAHHLRFAVASRYVALYCWPELFEAAEPAGSRAVATSPLLRALIDYAVDRGALDGRRPAERAAAVLIADQIRTETADALALPLPKSEPLRRVAETMAAQVKPRSLKALARGADASVRTLERRFEAETGMTIGRWRRRARMQRAVELLAGGASVKATAAALGYGGASAFIAAFRAAFGETPARYVAGRMPGLTRSPASPVL